VHVIEKAFDVDVGEREQLLFILIGVVIGLIVVSYLLGKQGERKRAKPKDVAKIQANPAEKTAKK
jgi:ABC-type cobalt transport system substrate-binding protein